MSTQRGAWFWALTFFLLILAGSMMPFWFYKNHKKKGSWK